MKTSNRPTVANGTPNKMFEFLKFELTGLRIEL